MMRIFTCLILGMALLTACGSASATPTAIMETMPALPTSTPMPSDTPLPTAIASQVVINAVLLQQVNVRNGPGTGYDVIGLLDAGQMVDVIAQSADSGWYQIIYPAGIDGIAWVAAQYVSTSGNIVPSLTPQVTPTSPGPTGTVTQRLNVRSGPEMNYESLGLLEANTIVVLMGKNETGTWLQILYQNGSGGTGWVTAAYVQTNDAENLQVLNALGTPVTPGANDETLILGATPTPTIGPSLIDNDTPSMPVARVTFSPAGTRRFSYQDDVSIPQGDPEDWIEFTPYALPGNEIASLIIQLNCYGNGSLVVQLWKDGVQLSDWGSLTCGDFGRNLLLPAGGTYQLHIYPENGSGLQYIYYYLTMSNIY